MPKRIVVSVAAVVALFTAGTGIAEAGTLTVEVLSNRANLISGGDALVAVKLPRSVKPASVKMTLNSSDVTSQFALRQNGSYEGLLSALQLVFAGGTYIPPEILAREGLSKPAPVQFVGDRTMVSPADVGLTERQLDVLALMMQGKNNKVICRTLNLAVTLAKQEVTVTVVDAHVARPALGERLGLPPAPGLREVLAGQMPPAWCLQETVLANLCLLPAGLIGQPREDADEAAIVESLRDRNDCVLIDAGPWADAGLTASLAGGSDAVYLVVRQASAAESTALQDKILQQTGRLRGCVLTARET